MEEALGFGDIVNTDVDGKAGGLVVVLRLDIAAHQSAVTDDEPSMHDFGAPLGRHLLRRGTAFMRKHGFDFAVEDVCVEFESLFTVAVEMEISVELHGPGPPKITELSNKAEGGGRECAAGPLVNAS